MERLRGHADARVDEKGRIKMPAVFKKTLEGAYGGALFITALTDDYLQVYPLAEWEAIEEKVNSLGSMNPRRRRFMTRANRTGCEVEMDSQGRITLKPGQRELVGIEEKVVLIGCTNHLEIHAAERLQELDGEDSFSPEDFDALGI